MKKVLSYALSLLLVLSLLVIPNDEVQAANVSLGVSASTVNIGDTVTATVTVPDGITATVDLIFPTDVLSFSSSSVDVGNNGGTITINLGKMSMANTNSVTITFKANASGSATLNANVISAVDNNTVENVELNGASTTITVANQTSDSGNDGGGEEEEEEPQKSADNSLSSLKLSSGSLSPAFKPNVTKYSATVEYDVDKLVVSAKTSNSKAEIESVTGDGNVELKVGQNTIQVVVKAENGVKATYTIVVTRKTEAESAPEPSESESASESETTTEVNEVLQWNGEQLQAAESIPEDVIPESFESTLLVVNGQQLQGLSFGKADLKLVYLNNANGAGSLYVYDEALQTVYPFIKIESEKSYVIVLLPDEQNAPAPDGFESCTFSIEGKGLVSAYQLKDVSSETMEDSDDTEIVEDAASVWNLFTPEVFLGAEPKASEFYLIYCMNDEGERGWYLYDSVEETFQRYLALSPVQEEEVSGDIDEKYAELEEELKAAKMTQYIIIGVAAAVVLILVIVIIVFAVKSRGTEDDFFDEYEDDDEEDDDVEQEDEVKSAGEIVVDGMVIKEVVVEEAVSENKKSETKNDADDDDGLEFIDFE